MIAPHPDIVLLLDTHGESDCYIGMEISREAFESRKHKGGRFERFSEPGVGVDFNDFDFCR